QKRIGEEGPIAPARAKPSEEGRRFLEREKHLPLQEQTGRTPAPMAAQAPVVRPAVSPAPASTAPRPQPVVVAPQPIASKPAAAAPTIQVAKPAAKPAVAAEPVSAGESEIPCPACGAMISGDAIMCYACGHRLHDEATDDDTTDPEGEREILCPAGMAMIARDP